MDEISYHTAKTTFYRIADDHGLVAASATIRQAITPGSRWGHDDVSTWTDNYILARYGRKAV
ncbi:hypothetical protein [Saccharopolyspora shandongensis]|uniref:hypothetical protein n=1 Tax=Saccharopolyspora shandongensis TaxID=418495 RepID=UPI0033F57319